MKYFVIAGEASGDLHATNLINALREHDRDARFYAYGGELMEAAGAKMLRYYRDIAYMGVVSVVMHAGTILRAMARCKKEIMKLRPDVVILVDYPGFNLAIAKYVKTKTSIPVYYYIAPKVWAWKENRIKLLRAYVDEIFSILPFEGDFFKQRGVDIHYVGNPTVDEVEDFMRVHYADSRNDFTMSNGLDPKKRIIAILAGSRKQEINYNLRRMILAAQPFTEKGFQLVVAGAPNIDYNIYMRNIPSGMMENGDVRIVSGKTYGLLQFASCALVTSGTATLETALLRVPQVVCYYIPMGGIVSFLRKILLKVRFISLVNLIAGDEIVKELVADGMTTDNVREALVKIAPGGSCRSRVLRGYEDVIRILGGSGASARAAQEMTLCLQRRKENE